MGAITGKPDLELITYTLKMFKKAGIEAVHDLRVSVCELEYLEDEWFDSWNIVETAEKLGYKAIWLYDEISCFRTMRRQNHATLKDFQLKTLRKTKSGWNQII